MTQTSGQSIQTARLHGGVSSHPAETPGLSDMIAGYLEQQEALGDPTGQTAVERFSAWHDDLEAPSQAKYYKALLPTRAPEKGEQYAFDVDLDRCSGCKACVTACHAMNGLDESETWRNVGLLVGNTADFPSLRHVTTACHHCLDPACLNACPVNAYEKDDVTGIVVHLDDQCIGCKYCTMACPYEVPKYHHRKGIVRKCDLCRQRLQDDEAPACVQACPNEAIRVVVVSREEILSQADDARLVPGAVDSEFTHPTTQYRASDVAVTDLMPADRLCLKCEEPHWPLVVLLVFSQLSVGAIVAGVIVQILAGFADAERFLWMQTSLALLFSLVGALASVLHLGRPQYGFRAFLGLRHSWMSREVVGFGIYMPLVAIAWGIATLNSNDVFVPYWLQTVLQLAACLIGVLTVWCSIRIYQYTKRSLWSGWSSSLRFFGTAVVLGTATASVSSAWLAASGQGAAKLTTALCAMLLVGMIGKLIFEASLFRSLGDDDSSPRKPSAKLMVGPLAGITIARFACGLLGGVALPLSVILAGQLWPDVAVFSVAVSALVLCLTGEVLERCLYFSAVVPWKMPGGFTQ